MYASRTGSQYNASAVETHLKPNPAPMHRSGDGLLLEEVLMKLLPSADGFHLGLEDEGSTGNWEVLHASGIHIGASRV